MSQEYFRFRTNIYHLYNKILRRWKYKRSATIVAYSKISYLFAFASFRWSKKEWRNAKIKHLFYINAIKLNQIASDHITLIFQLQMCQSFISNWLYHTELLTRRSCVYLNGYFEMFDLTNKETSVQGPNQVPVLPRVLQLSDQCPLHFWK